MNTAPTMQSTTTPTATSTTSATAALASAMTSTGRSIAALSQDHPVLLVFLRHFGCTFCREALADLSSRRAAIEATGARIVLVHMVSPAQAAVYLARYNLGDLPSVSDPEKALYGAMGLRRGTLWQLFGIKSLWRGLTAGVFAGHGVGKLAGDGFQMPGVFLIAKGQVVRTFRHETAADRPDYDALACPV